MKSGDMAGLPAELIAAKFGLPFRRSDDMLNTQDSRCRPSAREHYNATIRHFVETGELVEKQMQEFAHIVNPPGANVAAWFAYCEAAENIERWMAAHPGEAAKLKTGGAADAPAQVPEPAESQQSAAKEKAEDVLQTEEISAADDEAAARAEERGLPFRSLMQFQWAPKEMRRFARDEYNRVIREFLETGDAPGLVRKDFGWLADHPGAEDFALKAHRMAQQAIRDWKDEHVRTPPEPARVPAVAEPEVKEHNPRPNAVTVRGEAFDLEVSGLREWDKPQPVAQLSVSEEARRLFRAPMPDDETEALLNALIGEMHFNMREIAFRSMCQVKDLNDRMNWVNASIKIAECGAKVAESVARLRGFEEPDSRRRRRSGQQ
jgi:hypothetical protein